MAVHTFHALLCREIVRRKIDEAAQTKITLALRQ